MNRCIDLLVETTYMTGNACCQVVETVHCPGASSQAMRTGPFADPRSALVRFVVARFRAARG
jgi:hypothetical protein